METAYNRIVVTGMGVINPLGLGTNLMWQSLIEGKSGVDYITSFDTRGFKTRFAAQVKDFDATNYLDRRTARHMDRFTQFAVVAAHEAVGQSGLNIDRSIANEVGVAIGTGIGGLATLTTQMEMLRERGPDRVNPFLIPMMVSDSASGQISIALKATGINFCVTSSCASSADAIGVAYAAIKRGEAQVMISGGAEAAVVPIGIAGFNAVGALSVRNDAPQEASRPFDLERDGFVMGEGAAILILENLNFALSRGAKILAEIVGYGATSDAYHITQPLESGDGGARAMRLALDRAGIDISEIDYINAHGTSTLLNDKSETLAIKSVFGDRAYQIPISSTKSMMGHLLGASSAAEAVICILTLQHDVIPPTINLRRPDPDCDLDYVPNEARHQEVRTALSNSFGFGGHNSTLILREYC